MRDDGHSEGYIRRVETEVRWLAKNGGDYDSYEAACEARQAGTESSKMMRHYNLMYGILMRFDLYGEYPDYRRTRPLRAYGARWRLTGEFAETIASFGEDARRRGLEEGTIANYARNAACFLLAMQERGLASLAEISEDDALSFFADEAGCPTRSRTYAGNVRAVLSSDLGCLADDAHAVAEMLPRVRSKRRNIQYLQPEEAGSIRSALHDPSAPLTFRDRAIGSLLFFTGLRGCDIAALEMDDILWDRDEIGVVQGKTGAFLSLPLTAPVGNAILDYLVEERPESDDPHVFLGLTKPHYPATAKSVWYAAEHVYDAAGVRPPGNRRGTHLFRHNAATAMIGAGAPRPVVSAVLGHEDPNSLDHYLSADIAHLRECALDVGRFPVRKGVFDV
jgi:integrase